jgi:two-component system, chemotaxis family, protein-glutamate methylesterase/glutaminase
MEKKISVLVVDDSALIRKILTEIINSDSRMTVIGTASNPLIARDKIKMLQPDVITLDIEMPKMDGISFLKNLMRLRPMPVIMISTLTQKGANATLDALEIGAVDCIAKANLGDPKALEQQREEVVNKIMVASKAKVRAFNPDLFKNRSDVKQIKHAWDKQTVIAIGASTGGTEAIKEVLIRLPQNLPPVVITQHIPPTFSASFAQRMDKTCVLNVVEAQDGMTLRPGYVYIAPGDYHLSIQPRLTGYTCKVKRGERVNRHMPSVEVLFDSVREQCKSAKKVCAVMLTGMGADGASAMKLLRDEGCYTIAQNEASSVVWGMPGTVVELDGAVDVVSLEHIAAKIINWVNH